jgi:hypothetical protein
MSADSASIVVEQISSKLNLHLFAGEGLYVSGGRNLGFPACTAVTKLSEAQVMSRTGCVERVAKPGLGARIGCVERVAKTGQLRPGAEPA